MLCSKKSPILNAVKYVLLVPILLFLIQSFSPNRHGGIPTLCPVENPVVSLNFGFQGEHPVYKKSFTHKGIDFRADLGTDIKATGDGIVIEASDTKKGYGKLIIIDHGNEYLTLYAHLNDFLIKEGDKVIRGQIIGHVGNTGYSTGPHLHYEVRKEGVKVDPTNYIEGLKTD